jgi:DNA-binding LacI/PurR family transcriptional regulator
MGNPQDSVRSGKSAEVVRQIREGLRAGRYPARLPGTHDFAAEFGVNKNTVDKALRRLIEEGLVVRIQGKGTYVAGQEPQGSESSRRINSRRYAFIIDRDDYYSGYLKMLDACDEEVAKVNGATLFFQVDRDAEPAKLLGRLRAWQVESVFACGMIMDDLLREIKREFNVILIDYRVESIPVNNVIWNNYEAGVEIAGRLVQRGCRHFICIQACPPSPAKKRLTSFNYLERVRGFKDGLEAAGQKMALHTVDWQFADRAANARIAEDLATGARGMAVLSPCYQLAVQALLKTGKVGLLSAGIKIGSFVNDNERHCLTEGVYAVLDAGKCAKSAAAILLNSLGRPAEKYKTVIMDNEYIEK